MCTTLALFTFLAATLGLTIPSTMDADTGGPIDIVSGAPDRLDVATYHREPAPNYMVFEYRRFDENDCEKELSDFPEIAIAPARTARCTTFSDGVARSLELVPQGWHNFGRLGDFPERDARCVMYGFTEKGCQGDAALHNRWGEFNCYYFPTNIYWTKWATIKSFNISCPGLDDWHSDRSANANGAWFGGDQNGDQAHKGRWRANLVPPKDRPHPHPDGFVLADGAPVPAGPLNASSPNVTWYRVAGEVAEWRQLVDEDGDAMPEVEELTTYTHDGKNGDRWNTGRPVEKSKAVPLAEEEEES